MAEYRQCEFHLLRYVPDAVKDEFVNLGVVLLETGEDPALPPKEGGRTGHPGESQVSSFKFPPCPQRTGTRVWHPAAKD